uniref:Uncharacterized protein n=1 Tax=Anguilla anguilla TaxID=7936 RepID=A0A0E9PZ91_ANGAN
MWHWVCPSLGAKGAVIHSKGQRQELALFFST